MKTDIELRALYRKHARDLLPLTGDQDADFVASEPVDLPEVHQRADCVVKLRRGGEVYYRHIEFQGEKDTAMAVLAGRRAPAPPSEIPKGKVRGFSPKTADPRESAPEKQSFVYNT